MSPETSVTPLINDKQTWGKIKLLKNLGVCHTDIIMGVYENCEQTYSDEELVPQHTGISRILY